MYWNFWPCCKNYNFGVLDLAVGPNVPAVQKSMSNLVWGQLMIGCADRAGKKDRNVNTKLVIPGIRSVDFLRSSTIKYNICFLTRAASLTITAKSSFESHQNFNDGWRHSHCHLSSSSSSFFPSFSPLKCHFSTC